MAHVLRVLALGLTATALTPPAGHSQSEPSRRVRALLEHLSLRDQVAQLVMPWLAGTYAAVDAAALAQARAWVDSLHVGGIIISIGSPLDIAQKLNFLQRRSRLPLLVASDLEGGTAFRFQGGTAFPTNMGVGASGRERDAYLMGRITAIEGRAVGVQLTFSPAADVNNNPANPIINTRSFGGDAAAVGRMVAAAVRGIRSAGMYSTVKHFPGHGDTETDSHLALPVIAVDWPRLDAVELVPFRAAIAANVDAVMSAHIALPGIDSDPTRPATLSPDILTGVLRDSLGFDGLVATDALNMGALVSRYGGGEAAVLAFLAGSDLLLQPASPAETIAAVTAAVESGRISRERLRRSVVRLLTLKERARLWERRTVSLERVGRVVGQQAFLDTAQAVSARSIVLVRDGSGVVDSLRARAGRLGVVTYGEGAIPAAGVDFAGRLQALGNSTTTFRLYPTSGPASYDSARVAALSSPTVIFAVGVRATSGKGSIAMPPPLAELIETTSRERPTVLVSFGSPYLLGQTPSAHALLLAWTSNPHTELAAAQALAGAAITGRLPIDLPPSYHIGDGLTKPATGRIRPARGRGA